MSSIGDRFAADGFLHVQKVFSASEVAELEGDFDRIIDQITASDECIDATWDGGKLRNSPGLATGSCTRTTCRNIPDGGWTPC